MHEGNYDLAISDCNQAIRLNPKYAVAYKNRVFGYAVQGNFDQAIADFTKRSDPTPRGSAYNNRGEVYKKMGQLDKAKQDFAKAKELEHKP